MRLLRSVLTPVFIAAALTGAGATAATADDIGIVGVHQTPDFSSYQDCEAIIDDSGVTAECASLSMIDD